MSTDARLHTPAALRNRDPILSVLKEVFPAAGTILEIASGSGEHARDFAAAFPGVIWCPTDFDERALASIEAYRRLEGSENLRPPVLLDVTDTDWPVAAADAMLCVNMIHISPWQCCIGLMQGAGRTLAPGGLLILYGPFSRGGAHTAPSNAAFDASLKRQNPEWGVRDLDDVAAVGQESGFSLDRVIDMPSNNFCVILRSQTV